MSDTEIREKVADELRRVADDLESDDLVLTENMRYTRVGGNRTELPSEVELSYYVDGVGERHIQVRI